AGLLGEEAVDGGDGAGHHDAGLDRTRSHADQAQERHAGQHQARDEGAGAQRPRHPPRARDPTRQGVELPLDHATGERNVSLDLSWAASHRQFSSSEFNVSWGHERWMNRHALHASTPSETSVTPPPAISRGSHRAPKIGDRAAASSTTNAAISAMAAGTARAIVVTSVR